MVQQTHIYYWDHALQDRYGQDIIVRFSFMLTIRMGHRNRAYLPINLGAKMLRYSDQSFLTTILNRITDKQLILVQTDGPYRLHYLPVLPSYTVNKKLGSKQQNSFIIEVIT